MPFLLCCAQLHPFNTPGKPIPAAPCTPGAGLWRELLEDTSKCACEWLNTILVQKLVFAAVFFQLHPHSLPDLACPVMG